MHCTLTLVSYCQQLSQSNVFTVYVMGSNDFIVEARNIVKKIEAEEFDFGVPIRKLQFLACCKSAQKLSYSDVHQFVESVLTVFPPYVLDVLDPIVGDDDEPVNDELDDNMALSSDSEAEHRAEAMEIDADVSAGSSGPLIVPAKKDSDYEKVPSYLPYNKYQWGNAVGSLAKPCSNSNRLFTFTEPKGDFEAMPQFIQQLDMGTRNQIAGSSFKSVSFQFRFTIIAPKTND